MVFIKNKHLTKLNRLLRKIGLFEFLLALVFLSILGFVMIQTKTKKSWLKVEVKITSRYWWSESNVAPPFWLGESISVGDQEFDFRGEKMAEVLKVRFYEKSTGGVEPTARKDYYLTLDLSVAKDKKTGKIKFKNVPLEVGAPIELHLSKTYVSGLVTRMEGFSDEKNSQELIIEGIWLNTFPWSAEAIRVGGEMKDGLGQTVAKIIDKKISQAEMTVVTSDGRVLVRRDPRKRDVWVKAKIAVGRQGETFYFREDQKVKIGQNLFFHLPEVEVVWLSVTKVFNTDGQRIY